MNNKRRIVLVTGGAGFIGSNFIRHILAEHPDWIVINLDKLTYAGNLANLQDIERLYGKSALENEGDSSPHPETASQNPRYHFVKGDITDRDLVDSIFSGSYFTHEDPRRDNYMPPTADHEPTIDAVVNFAAESHVDRSVKDAAPFVKTNIEGTQALLDVSKKYWLDEKQNFSSNNSRISPTFVQISTDEVYGSLRETGKFSEDSPLKPNNPYSASKASADMLCRSYYQAYDFPVIITRSSNNYGPYQFPEKLIPLMIRNALAGEELPVYGEGKEIRDWLFVKDNCRAIDTVLRNGESGEVYNIGGDSEKQNIEVVRDICRILEEKKSPQFFEDSSRPEELIKFIEDPRGGAHDFRYALDFSKIEEELGWKPDYEFRTGLEETVEWYLNHQDWVEGVVSGEYKDYYKDLYGSD